MSENEVSEMTQPGEPLRILQLIKSAQQKHGLRHENYQRYRGYCARRIERIRKSLKFTHSHKCVPNRTAKFVARNVTAELVGDIRFLQIVVFEVERNWAYAMQLKYETMDEPLKRKKFHMRQKLRRAVKCVEFLESLVDKNPLVHELTTKETKSYSGFIRASLSLEFKEWNKAVEFFESARIGYTELLEGVKGGDLEEMYSAKLHEVENLLKLCCSQTGDADVLLSTVNSLNLNAAEERKQTNEVKVDKEVVVLTKKQKNRIEKLRKVPTPVRPFFFDLALNFVQPKNEGTS